MFIAQNLTIMTKNQVVKKEQGKILLEVGDDVEVTFWCQQARFAAPGHHPS
jgi:protein involved in polysaccharide export with SLBB domain